MMGLLNISDWSFTQPHWFWLLLAVPVWMLWLRKPSQNRSFLWTTKNPEDMDQLELPWIPMLRKGLTVLKVLCFVAFVFAMAGPYSWKQGPPQEDYKKGIDILLALDVSKSMYTRDFNPNRMTAAKVVAQEFISKRDGDRIGLVVFAGEAYTACPLTTDYDILSKQIEVVDDSYIDEGTAIGTGLGTAVNRLMSDSLTTKVIILLTDGSNNAGEFTPSEAADLAKATNVRVYTIGIGTNSETLVPMMTPQGIRFQKQTVELDEASLQEIADKTGGKYYRAKDLTTLQNVYGEIDALEKQKFLDEVLEGEPPVDPTFWLTILLLSFAVVWMVERSLFPYAE